MSDATTAPAAPVELLAPFLKPGMFRALGDPTRMTLLARLATASGAISVTELSSCCGVHLSGVSRHLKILHDAGLVHAERQGREVLYGLDCLALAGALRAMAGALERCHEQCCRAPSCHSQGEPNDDDASDDEP